MKTASLYNGMVTIETPKKVLFRIGVQHFVRNGKKEGNLWVVKNVIVGSQYINFGIAYSEAEKIFAQKEAIKEACQQQDEHDSWIRTNRFLCKRDGSNESE